MNYDKYSLNQILLVKNEDPANYKGWTKQQFLKLLNFRQKSIKPKVFKKIIVKNLDV